MEVKGETPLEVVMGYSGLWESTFSSKGRGNHSLTAKGARQTRGDWRRSRDIRRHNIQPVC